MAGLAPATAGGRRVIVVGGGMCGLTAALQLASHGVSVTVMEASERLGGLAAPWSVDRHSWDRFYHVVLEDDVELLELLASIGLGDAIDWRRTRTGFFIDGDVLELTSLVDFIRFRAIGPIDKVRLAVTLLAARRAVANDGGDRDVTAETWLRRVGGQNNFERLWKPLLRAKFGSEAGAVSADLLQAIIARMLGARRGERRSERFGGIAGGYTAVLSALAARCEMLGVDIRLSSPVSSIVRRDGRAVIADAGVPSHDAAIVATPPLTAAALIADASPAEAAIFRGVRMAGVACTSLLLKKPLGPHYITNIAEEMDISAVIELTNVVDAARFGGLSLVYLPRYAPAAQIAALDDTTESARAIAALQHVYPGFRPEHIIVQRHARAASVFPYRRAGDPVPKIAAQSECPGLYFATTAQIVGPQNVNASVVLATQVVERLLATEAVVR